MVAIKKDALIKKITTVNRPFYCGLSGSLGAGKTTLVRDVFFELGFLGHVKSPSFSIIEIYEEIGFAHMDLYRLQAATRNDMFSIGLWDLITDGYSLFIEWPERLSSGIIKFDFMVEITVTNDVRSYSFL